MDYRINSLLALILMGLTITVITPSRSAAQSKAIINQQKLSFVNFEHHANEAETSFDLQFETDSLIISGQANTFIDGYDSLKLDSYEVLSNADNLIKIEGYLFNKQSQDKLKWVSAVSFKTDPKNTSLVSGSYIQFGAYNKLENAEKGLEFFEAFNPDIVFVGGMYKLVLPYDKGDYKKAREKYEHYNIWKAEYQNVKLIQAAHIDVLVSSVSREGKMSVIGGY